MHSGKHPMHSVNSSHQMPSVSGRHIDNHKRKILEISGKHLMLSDHIPCGKNWICSGRHPVLSDNIRYGRHWMCSGRHPIFPIRSDFSDLFRAPLGILPQLNHSTESAVAIQVAIQQRKCVSSDNTI